MSSNKAMQADEVAPSQLIAGRSQPNRSEREPVTMPPESTASSTDRPLPFRKMGEFLTAIPPNTMVALDGGLVQYSGSSQRTLVTPDVILHCPSDACNGERIFKHDNSHHILPAKKWMLFWLVYQCRNCARHRKTFAVQVYSEGDGLGNIQKVGEIPPFGPPLPSRVMKLVGPDRELFLKGRRAESQGMGIGSFAYYRRVVENQKDRVFEEAPR